MPASKIPAVDLVKRSKKRLIMITQCFPDQWMTSRRLVFQHIPVGIQHRLFCVIYHWKYYSDFINVIIIRNMWILRFRQQLCGISDISSVIWKGETSTAHVPTSTLCTDPTSTVTSNPYWLLHLIGNKRFQDDMFLCIEMCGQVIGILWLWLLCCLAAAGSENFFPNNVLPACTFHWLLPQPFSVVLSPNVTPLLSWIY